MFKKSSFLLLAVLCALAACQAAPQAPRSSTYSDQTTGGVSSSGPAAPPVEQPVPAKDGQANTAEGHGVAQASADRLVIKNANLALVVKDPAAVVNSISALADSLKGFVVNSSVTQVSVDTQGNKIMSGQIAVRIPAENLADAVAQIKALAVTVKSENVTGEDVTAQYVDLQSQLTNLEAEVVQLQKIMDTTTKAEDVLAIYKEIASVQGQIETLKGQIKYYHDSAAMSLISVTLEQEWTSQPLETGSWKPEGVLKSIAEAWVGTYQVVATLALWGGIYCLPIVLVLGVLGGLLYFGVRMLTRRRRRGQRPPAAQP